MTQYKILVVDDDRTTRKVIELQLNNLGYRVLDGAQSGPEGVEKVKQERPDLVLMDIQLGKDMDGIEAARIIMQEYSLPVVFVTAYGNDENLKRAKKLNPAGFINKPVREVDLHANIEIALERHTYAASSEIDLPPAARSRSAPLQLISNDRGIIQRRTARIEKAIAEYQVTSEYDLLPKDHITLVANTLEKNKPQMLSGRIGEYILWWKYQPMKSGTNVRVSIYDITEQYGTTVLGVDQAPLSEALDHLASGVLLVNEHLKVFYKNSSARKFMDEDTMIILKDDHLSCKSPELTAELHQLVLKDTGDTLSINRGDKKPPLHIFVYPMHSRAMNYGRNLPIAIIFLFETINDVERIGDIIRMLYSLSPTEARIAAMLVFNPHLEDVAGKMGITYNTARTHLKRIYAKTGTNRMSSLVHRIMTGPVGILIHSRE